MLIACPAAQVRGVQLAAKGVGEAFTGGRDLHQMLHSLASTTVAVEAYFAQPCFQRVLPEELKGWAKSLCGEAKEAHERLRCVPAPPVSLLSLTMLSTLAISFPRCCCIQRCTRQ